MRELSSPAEVADATADLLLAWCAQAMLPTHPTPGGAAWTEHGAVAVFAPGLYHRDRLVLSGEPPAVVKLLHRLRAELPPTVVPVLPTTLADEVLAIDPGLTEVVRFGWMDTVGAPGAPVDDVRWLTPDEEGQAEALLRVANPDSWLMPGAPGARRWAGRFDGDTLVSVAGDGWPAPATGFIAGVATARSHRGRGASAAVCAFVRDALLAERGACGLMAYADNATAIRLYGRLGFAYRSLTALSFA